MKYVVVVSGVLRCVFFIFCFLHNVDSQLLNTDIINNVSGDSKMLW